MEKENKIGQPLIILGVTIIILYAISFVKVDYEIPGINFKLKNVDIFSDIKDQLVTDPQPSNEMNKLLLTQPKVFNMASMDFSNIISSVISYFESEPGGKPNAPSILLQGKKTPITGNTRQLHFFFDALKNAKSKIVRVAHYGDSAIEGDLITSDIREKMQSRFGGNGVGWLGITSQDITFRMTTKHSFSQGNWETAALYLSNPKGLPLGISGEACVPKGNAWVQYETTTMRRYLKDFSLVRLYYANAKNSTINYSFDNGAKQTVALKPGIALQELILKPSSRAKSIKIEFPLADQAYFYGVSLENEPGLYIDNFPLRGNTGVDLGSLQVGLLKEFSKYLDYKLIILEFGLNIAGSRNTDYSWYEKEMVKMIKNLKSAFPNTSFLMISIHDKSMKKGSGFVTDPTILKLLETQKNIAREADVAIWNLFEAMGGENSMPNWVNANPPLAFKDFIHFNDQGAKKVADMLTDALLDLNK
jgi:lysophospholipase L1-like esterase